MMRNMGSDEFAEFETTEDEIDAMMAAGEPVKVDVPGQGIEAMFRRGTAPNRSWGGSSVVSTYAGWPVSVNVGGAVRVPSGLVA